MRAKTAVSIIISLGLFVTPVLAIESTASETPAKKIENRVEKRIDRVEKRVETRIATKEAKMAARIEEMRTKIASREAMLRTKLQAFKDQKKAEIAERVNTNLNRINQNQTSQMQKHLDLMSSILDRLEKRINERTADIKDPSTAKEAIGSARSNIASGEAAVKLQAENDYTLAVSSESKVRQDAQKIREQLHQDLQQVRKLVIDAKQSVANAIRIAKSGRIELPKEGTSSGNK